MRMVKRMVDLYQVSSLKGSTNTMTSSLLKPHTNTYTGCKQRTEARALKQTTKDNGQVLSS